MTYLLTQMFLYLLIAFLLGLLLGWLFWRYGKPSMSDYDAIRAERDSLRAERDAMSGDAQSWAEERTALTTNLDACRTRSTKERESIERLTAENDELRRELDAKISAPAAVAAPIAAAAAGAAEAAEGAGTQPEGLSGPRGGVADDLKKINGIGPKLENMLNGMGYYHFDQLADWTTEELAWVDFNLEGFKGRATRDNWVPQAREFAKS